MYLTSLTVSGFKSFARKSTLIFPSSITGIVGPNGSGKSNTADAFRFALGEQSMKALRSKKADELIWGGSASVPRANRASVSLAFNNKNRILPLDFDEIILERSIYRDGIQEYRINGTKVRLKDITELLTSAHIGSSSYHILSQGEADKALGASPQERKEMIEDALGLRGYQYKKNESIKKLEKTKEHTQQIENLRREQYPHLSHLKRQIQKLEKAEAVKEELVFSYKEYLLSEDIFLEREEKKLSLSLLKNLEEKERDISLKIQFLEKKIESHKKKEEEKNAPEEASILNEMTLLRAKLAEYTRTLGKTEGMCEVLEENIKREKEMKEKIKRKELESTHLSLSKEQLSLFIQTLKRGMTLLQKTEGHLSKNIFSEIEEIIEHFYKNVFERTEEKKIRNEKEEENALFLLEKAQKEALRIGKEIVRIRESLVLYEKKREEKRREDNERREEYHSEEKELYSLQNEKNLVQNSIRTFQEKRHRLQREMEAYKEEISEGMVLIGRSILLYKEEKENKTEEEKENLYEKGKNREKQNLKRKEVEKLKIKLETLGTTEGAHILRKEFEEAKEREDFLIKELDDLKESTNALEKIIKEIEKDIEVQFRSGMHRINETFNTFIQIMFGGGSGKVSLISAQEKIEEEQDKKNGVELEVTLPKKRIHSLMMLSGGERTLISIAFIFAMSQINPPPFLILDETDAALDEANSKRYGEMIQHLSQKSQLVLITHNRETMAYAGMLYGVTMAQDGMSRTLSVSLETGEKKA
jgi:chromosome segregation protein